MSADLYFTLLPCLLRELLALAAALVLPALHLFVNWINAL